MAKEIQSTATTTNDIAVAQNATSCRRSQRFCSPCAIAGMPVSVVSIEERKTM